jgi:hypothetical protein
MTDLRDRPDEDEIEVTEEMIEAARAAYAGLTEYDWESSVAACLEVVLRQALLVSCSKASLVHIERTSLRSGSVPK